MSCSLKLSKRNDEPASVLVIWVLLRQACSKKTSKADKI